MSSAVGADFHFVDQPIADRLRGLASDAGATRSVIDHGCGVGANLTHSVLVFERLPLAGGQRG